MENKTLADEELVVLYKQGNESAFEELVARYNKAIKYFARSFFIFGGDIEDVISEGVLGLFKAVNSFDEKYNFKTFALTCIKRSILSAVRSGSREKNMALNFAVELTDKDDFELFVSDETLDPAEKLNQTEQRTEVFKRLKSVLSDLEYKILLFYVDGYTYEEISLKVGKDAKAVDNAVQRIRKKVVKEFKV